MKKLAAFAFILVGNSLFTVSAEAKAILSDPSREKIVITVKKDILVEKGTASLFFVENKFVANSEKYPATDAGFEQKLIAKFGRAAVANKKLNPNAGGFVTPATFCMVQLNNNDGGLIAKGAQFTAVNELAVQEYGGQTLWMWTNGFLLVCQNVATAESRATLGSYDLGRPTHSLTAKNLGKHIGKYFDFEVVQKQYKP